MTLLDPRTTYKPILYPTAYELWERQQQLHWLPSEVNMGDDIKDWKTRLTESELNLTMHIFRLFTQNDIEVNNCYLDIYLPRIRHPEVRMMLTSFANMETIHIAAYALLLDTLGIPDSEHQAFLEYSEMKAKYEFMHKFNNDTDENLALAMAVFGGLVEGLSLFASFAMLLNFQRFGKMKGMCQIVAWSVRDETLHVESMAWLYRTLVNELPHLHAPEVIIMHTKELVGHEDKFIDLAFEMGTIEGISAVDMKQYIRYIANRRLSALGVSPIYDIKTNPLDWMDEMLNAPEFTNFFENRVTEYSKSSTGGEWDEIF